MSRRIYLATSWRNPFHADILCLLRDKGHLVYNFRDPEYAFSWDQSNMSDKPTAKEQRSVLLRDARCAQGFVSDFRGMLWADTCVMLLPCGRSAHMELGYCAGMGKHSIIYLRDGEEPDLMNLLAHELVTSDQQLLEVLGSV